MGRNVKAKTGSTQQKRRKKSDGPSAGGSSPALSATSSSGGMSTPSLRECDQCGNSMLLEGVAKTWPLGKKSVLSTGCQICDFVAFRRSQRPCVQCARTSCDHFCEWCGRGFHAKCAKVQQQDVGNPHGFCCHKCEAEQSEGGHDTDDEETKGEEDVGSRCGSCRLPFAASTGKEVDEMKVMTGFQVNQAVLVDNDEVLYNALITEVDTKDERIKIHFTRWSKSFDDWYAMDDEHINESLACDCCNDWFHIGCLPPIKSSGRWKDSTYVCPRCIDDARAFHNGSRAVMRAKAVYVSTSTAIAKAVKKTMSPKESERAPGTVAKTKKLGKAVVVMDDDDDDMDKKKKKNDGERSRITKTPSKKKRKLPEVVYYPVGKQAKEDLNESKTKSAAGVASGSKTVMSVTGKEFTDADAALNLASAPLEAKSDLPNVHTPTTEVNAKVNAKILEVPSVNANAVVSANASAPMHASPEHLVKVATEAHSSPFKAAAAKIGANYKPAIGEADVDQHERKQAATSQTTGAEHSNRYSSCNTVMSLLNSPPANETLIKTFKPTVTSLPMLNPADTTCDASSKPAMAMQANFQVYVKMEQKHGRFSLYPRSVPDGKPAQTVRKGSTKPVKTVAARRTKQSQTCRGLSAFDILREVAAQEIDEGAVLGKPKREKRPSGREINASACKRPNMDASTCTPGRTVSSEVYGNSAVPDINQSPQTRDRIQMNPFVDLHFSIRKEMYLRFCRLEEEGMLTRDSAHLLRSLIYPTSERFQDLKFVYLVNKDLPSVQLTKRLLEAVPYPPTVTKPSATTVPHAPPAVIRSPVGGKSLSGLPMSMGVFSAGLGRNLSPAGSSRMGLLPPPPGSTLLRPEPMRPDESSRVVPGSAVLQPQPQPQPPRTSGSSMPVHVITAKRPEMLIGGQLAPTRSPVTGTGSVASRQQQQQQQQQQRVLNSR